MKIRLIAMETSEKGYFFWSNYLIEASKSQNWKPYFQQKS